MNAETFERLLKQAVRTGREAIRRSDRAGKPGDDMDETGENVLFRMEAVDR